jgi:predicted nucleic acid-binding protein
VTAYVADASVAVKWYVPQVRSEEALRVLEPGNEIHVPDLVYADVGDILRRKVRREEISAPEARRIAGAVLAAPLEVHASAVLLDGALEVALRTARTVYDGFYVALAVALSVPMVTADGRLLRALERSPFREHVVWVEDLPGET